MICESNSHYFLTKDYSAPPYDVFMRDIGPISYYKCDACGFVLSRTHAELDAAIWNELNVNFHHYHESAAGSVCINQPPYLEQATMISLLGKNGILSLNSMLDYAAGYGSLSDILGRYFDIRLPIFDPYVKARDHERYLPVLDGARYQTVINSAMFEHVLRRADLDEVHNLVSADGCMLVHTVVCENVPEDPDWFYFVPPVHTAFHTNKSMQILMQQWGFRSSIYSPKAKTWVLLREPVEAVHNVVSNMNAELQSEHFYCKDGFVDYWKGY